MVIGGYVFSQNHFWSSQQCDSCVPQPWKGRPGLVFDWQTSIMRKVKLFRALTTAWAKGRGRSWGTERLSHLPRITALVENGVRPSTHEFNRFLSSHNSQFKVMSHNQHHPVGYYVIILTLGGRKLRSVGDMQTQDSHVHVLGLSTAGGDPRSHMVSQQSPVCFRSHFLCALPAIRLPPPLSLQVWSGQGPEDREARSYTASTRVHGDSHAFQRCDGPNIDWHTLFWGT